MYSMPKGGGGGGVGNGRSVYAVFDKHNGRPYSEIKLYENTRAEQHIKRDVHAAIGTI